MKKRLVCSIVVLFALMAVSAAVTSRAETYTNDCIPGGNTAMFNIDLRNEKEVVLSFAWQGNCDLWVQVQNSDFEIVVPSTSLSNTGGVITIPGGKVVYVEIWSEPTGSIERCNYSATWYLSGTGGPADVHTEAGLLMGPGDSNMFDVQAGTAQLTEVEFIVPDDLEFWVRVVGQDGVTELGDYKLDNDRLIQLIGGGIFHLTVYSKKGGGSWQATW